MLIILQNFAYFSGKTTFCHGNGNITTFKSQDMSKINVLYNSCLQKICNIYCLTGSSLRNSMRPNSRDMPIDRLYPGDIQSEEYLKLPWDRPQLEKEGKVGPKPSGRGQ